MTIELETPVDRLLVRAVHVAAFPSAVEADLVDRLRAQGHASISLVARDGSAIVGHVAFSPVTIHLADVREEGENRRGLGLAPLAVLPEFQRRGIGTALVNAGLTRLRNSGAGFVVVLGEPAYYARFGFQPASRYALTSKYNAGDAFQILAFDPSALPPGGGLVRYGDEFAEFE